MSLSRRGTLVRALTSPRCRYALAFIALLYGIAILAPALTPYEPGDSIDLSDPRYFPPSADTPLGTDTIGRDVLTRMLYGARMSLLIGLCSVLVALTIGTAVGAMAGYVGGWVDTILMRLVDVGLAIPRIFLILAILAFWKNVEYGVLIAILGTTGWFATSRLVRAEVQGVSAREYIAAARSAGLPPWRTLLRHVIPNAMTPAIVSATLGIGNIILIEAGLSFLGIGLPQEQASWGTIIKDGKDYLFETPLVATAPGLAIAVTVMAFSMLGDGLQEALDPKRR